MSILSCFQVFPLQSLPRYPAFTPMDYDSFDGILHYIFRSVSIMFTDVGEICRVDCLDSRKYLVQTLRGKHRSWGMLADRARSFQNISLRKSLFGAFRSRCASPQPSCCCQDSICCCTFSSGYRVSTHSHRRFPPLTIYLTLL